MKFSESWLRSYVNPSLSSQELAHALTMGGLEVEALEPVAAPFSGVVVGHVLSVQKHPDADRLQVCTVEVGEAQPLQIVCGAKNVRPGVKVPCARVGAQLPTLSIKQAKVRGVESSGMLCSAQELGLAEASEGLLILAEDAPIGIDVREYLDLDDTLFTLKLTPNRSDCLSVTGIAREVAAVAVCNFEVPEAATAPWESSVGELAISVDDQTDCPRYCGRIIRGIASGAVTPPWMLQRLERAGLRSVSAVVDVTNYVMLELGQPLHAFDLDKIGKEIRVRRARSSEQLMLLNGESVTLDEGFLTIADENGLLALAGIMGGQASSVGDQTKDIFLESAFFSPGVTAGRARRLNLSTDASYRFERGVDFGVTRDALERVTQLIIDICGGTAGPVSEVLGTLPSRDPIPLRTARARAVLGIDLVDEDIEMLLRRLQLGFVYENGTYFVSPPSYRFDLQQEVDLIEELARLYGYDAIPLQAPRVRAQMLPAREDAREIVDLSARLVDRGYQEVITYSFVEAGLEQQLAGAGAPAVTLQNPLSNQLAVMRRSLWPGLVDTLRYNLNNKQDRVRLFETGRCFSRHGDAQGVVPGFDQPARIGGIAYGAAVPEQWGSPARDIDFYDVKADVEALLPPNVAFTAEAHPALHPGQSARVALDGHWIGWLGTLHPRLCQQFEFPRAPILFEFDLEAVLGSAVPAYREFARLPHVRRDIAVIVPEDVVVGDLIEAMWGSAVPVVRDIALFDVYRGKGIDSDKKSLAFRVLMQDTQKTLTDDEADGAIARLTEVLCRRYNAQLRK